MGKEDADMPINDGDGASLTRRAMLVSAGTGIVSLLGGCQTNPFGTDTTDPSTEYPVYGYGGTPVSTRNQPESPTVTFHPTTSDRSVEAESVPPTPRTGDAANESPTHPVKSPTTTSTDEPSSRGSSEKSSSETASDGSSPVYGGSGSNGGKTGGKEGGLQRGEPPTPTEQQRTPSATQPPSPTDTSESIQTDRSTSTQTNKHTQTATKTQTQSPTSTQTGTQIPTSSGGEYEWGGQGYGDYGYGGVKP